MFSWLKIQGYDALDERVAEEEELLGRFEKGSEEYQEASDRADARFFGKIEALDEESQGCVDDIRSRFGRIFGR